MGLWGGRAKLSAEPSRMALLRNSSDTQHPTAAAVSNLVQSSMPMRFVSDHASEADGLHIVLLHPVNSALSLHGRAQASVSLPYLTARP